MLDSRQIRQLLEGLRLTVDMNRIRDETAGVASRMQRLYLDALRHNAPWPEKAPPEDPPRYSRPEHTAISDPNSWQWSMTSAQGAGTLRLSALIGNTSEHIEVQRTGRGPYDVTKRQRFWMDDPSFMSGGLYVNEPGIVTLYFTRDHSMEPWGGSDFVERSATEMRNEARAMFVERMHQVLLEPLRRAFRT